MWPSNEIVDNSHTFLMPMLAFLKIIIYTLMEKDIPICKSDWPSIASLVDS